MSERPFDVIVADSGEDETALLELLTFWQERPYLEPSEAFADRILPAGIREAAREARDTAYETDQVPERSQRFLFVFE